MVKPLVAIVGRPNVGKSTLFNRIVGRRLAITEDVPGTTRDRLYADAEWQGRVFALVDTGGLVPGSDDDLLARVYMQAQQAIADADVIVFLADVLDGVTATDQEIAKVLRRTQKPVILVANKADTAQRDMDAYDFYSLGWNEVYTTSTLHGAGVADLLDAVVAAFPEEKKEKEEPEAVKIAIVGRPNVGKSSLLNALLRE
jgi:GTP-binding protein